jgi:fructose-bisphosphate aldolase class II
MGLSKIRVATQFAQVFTDAIRVVLNKNGELVDPRKYLVAARNAEMETVRERNWFFGASGKAK